MLEPSIKSRPVYGTLEPQPGQSHIFVVDADGAEAIVDMAPKCADGFFAKATIVHISRESESRFLHAIEALRPAELIEVPTFEAGEAKLAPLFAKARMGTRVYSAGTEGIMGRTRRLALANGFELGAIVTEHRGSAARRVQCVHCKAFTDDVTSQPAVCSGCGLSLLVRDHYSHRLAAFQGVCIDAEEPGTAPAAEEIFR